MKRGFAAMAKIDLSINLLDNKGKKISDQFLDWAIAIGRLLIIITETVALGAFLYRFSIDRQLADLNDEIKKNDQIVSAFKTGEDTYRHMQTKLTVSKTQLAAPTETINLFRTMMQMSLKHTVSYNNLAVSENIMQMAIQANSTRAIAGFIEELKTIKRVKTFSVDKVDNKTSNATIIVTLTATLQPAIGAVKQPKQ